MHSPDRKIFVTLGSSGAVKALPAIMNAVAGLEVKVILATSSRVADSVPGVYSAPLLPYEETARNCELVISHGGTGGLYHTLAAGTPMLAIPNNIDNHLSTALMEEHGAGIGIRVEQANTRRICRAIIRLMEEPSYKNSAMQWSQTIRRYEWKQLFPQILAQWFAAREKPSTKHEPIREICAV